MAMPLKRPPRDEYAEACETMDYLEVAKKFGVAPRTVQTWAALYGISPKRKKVGVRRPDDWAEIAGDKTAAEWCEHFGVVPNRIYQWCKQTGVKCKRPVPGQISHSRLLSNFERKWQMWPRETF